MDEYDKYEARCKKLRTANERLLAGFETWLKSAGLSEKTISNHLSNIDFYINEGSIWIPVSYARSTPRRGLSSPLPRMRVLCTNWKNPRYQGSFSCEMPR
jgi:hypothetical protein